MTLSNATTVPRLVAAMSIAGVSELFLATGTLRLHLVLADGGGLLARAPSSPAATAQDVLAQEVGRLCWAHPDGVPPERLVGERVQAGDILAFLVVGAAVFPVRAPCDGTLQQRLAKDGDVIGYGDRVASVGPG